MRNNIATMLGLLAGFSLILACGESDGKRDRGGPNAATLTAADDPGKADDVAAADPGEVFTPKVELPELSNADTKVWSGLVNELLSPCGEPISVAQCSVQKDKTKCGKCDIAVKYVARLVRDGFSADEARKHYSLRFDADKVHKVDTDRAPFKGAAMAPVTIIEFSDFQCPFCKRAVPVLDEVVKKYPGKVRVVFMQYPLGMHEHAFDAARATIAAGRQGKFWEMHDSLFADQEHLEMRDLRKRATKIGLDMGRFLKDMANVEASEAFIEHSRGEGKKIGVDHTPYFLVNGRVFDEPLENLDAYLQETFALR